MRESDTIDDVRFEELLLSDVKLLDVRAPIEFASGSLPSSVNVPILSDDERKQVGTTYRIDGAEAAVVLGHQLVSGETKQARIDAWLDVLNRDPQAVVYCARGGQRSQLTCDWLKESGLEVPRINGGYKALRQFLLAELDRIPDGYTLSGCTGVGKTETIEALTCAIDLEGLANHRGSAFGRMLRGQPAQQSFENALAMELIRFRARGDKTLVMEDESRLIGRIHLEAPIMNALKSAPILFQEASFEERVERIHNDYILDNWREYGACQPNELKQHLVSDALPDDLSHVDQPFATFALRLLSSLHNIRKRLGGVRYESIRKEMTLALAEHASGDPSGHHRWIRELLVEYYDPMYTYQIDKKKERIVFRGDKNAIVEWMKDAQTRL
jgi:tRNA 2-selenouridine synthase